MGILQTGKIRLAKPWQAKYFVGKILAGKVRFYVLEIVHCLLLRCPWSTLPTVCYHLVLCPWVFCQSYFAHRILPVCTSHSSVLPSAGKIHIGKVMTGKVPHAKYECVKYNWQSTGGQKTLRSKNQLAKTNWVKYDRQMDARQSTSWAIQLAGKLRSTGPSYKLGTNFFLFLLRQNTLNYLIKLLNSWQNQTKIIELS